MNITKGEFNILNRLTILLRNRIFDITSPVGSCARDFILSRFISDTNNADVIIGYGDTR